MPVRIINKEDVKACSTDTQLNETFGEGNWCYGLKKNGEKESVCTSHPRKFNMTMYGDYSFVSSWDAKDECVHYRATPAKTFMFSVIEEGKTYKDTITTYEGLRTFYLEQEDDDITLTEYDQDKLFD